MPIIDRIKLPSGNIYILADSDAQSKLENVYTKSETYTRAEVLAAIADAMKGGYVAVNTLPTASEDTMGHIYLIPGQSGTGQNIKIEYVTIRSGSEGAYTYTWEELGTTELNLVNLTFEKGSGDNVLGEATTFTASKPAVNITGDTKTKVLTDQNVVDVVLSTEKSLMQAKASGGSVEASATDTFVKSYPGATSKLVTTTVPNVTGNTAVSIPNVTGNTEVSIPNVTGNAAKTLTFSMGTGAEATTLIIGGTGFASGSNTYQASEVTLGTELKASKVTLGSELSASKVTLGTAKTVATGSVAANGEGAGVMTGLGTAVTGNAVTGVRVSSQPTITLEEVKAEDATAPTVEFVKEATIPIPGVLVDVTQYATNPDAPAATVEAVTAVGSASLAEAPTITVGTNDKVKVAKYDDLELQKP